LSQKQQANVCMSSTPTEYGRASPITPPDDVSTDCDDARGECDDVGDDEEPVVEISVAAAANSTWWLPAEPTKDSVPYYESKKFFFGGGEIFMLDAYVYSTYSFLWKKFLVGRFSPQMQNLRLKISYFQ